MKLSKYQKYILLSLYNGGKIFEFDFPSEYGFDDADGNSHPFRKDSFKRLSESGLLEVSERPSIICRIYGLSQLGVNTINQ